MPYCANCGAEVNEDERFCRSCGGRLPEREHAREAPEEVRGGWESPPPRTDVRGWTSERPSPGGGAYLPPSGGASADIPYPISTFSWHWGGFLIGWLWSFFHGLAWVGIVMIVCWFIPWIGGMVNLGLSIWLGIEGHRMAWRNRTWQSPEQCIQVQRTWKTWGIVLTLLWFLMAVGFIFTVTFIGGGITEILDQMSSEWGVYPGY